MHKKFEPNHLTNKTHIFQIIGNPIYGRYERWFYG